MRKSLALFMVTVLVVAAAAAGVALAQEPSESEKTPARVEKGGDSRTPVATETPEAGKDADDGEKVEEKGKGDGQGRGLGGMWLLWLMLGGFFLLYIWMGRGRRKQQRQRQEMLSSLRKGDRVTSIGGIVGTVMEIRDDEVTVKVDESANVRMKFAKWAVRGVGDGSKAENPQQAARQ